MSHLILLRHGKSSWNKKNIFTGWVDVGLAKEGVEEACAVGWKIGHLDIDKIFVSQLVRAMMTAMIVMAYHPQKKVARCTHSPEDPMYAKSQFQSSPESETIPVIITADLNERMYGDLQGVNKEQAIHQYGKEQVQRWRRGYTDRPPGGESLEETSQRTLPYFHREIKKCVEQGENVLVVAHGNSIRSIVMELEELSSQQVVNIEIATGEPLVYQYIDQKFIKH